MHVNLMLCDETHRACGVLIIEGPDCNQRAIRRVLHVYTRSGQQRSTLALCHYAFLRTLGKLAVYLFQNVLPYLLSHSNHAVSRRSQRASPAQLKAQSIAEKHKCKRCGQAGMVVSTNQ